MKNLAVKTKQALSDAGLFTRRFRSGFSLHLTSRHILLGALFILNLLFFMVVGTAQKALVQQSIIKSLKQAVVVQSSQVKTLAKEKDQVAVLLQKQNRELTVKLRQIQTQNEEVCKIIGLKPKKVFRPAKIEGARAVPLSRLRLSYYKLQTELQNTQKDMGTLRTEARKYLVQKEREKILAQIEAVPSIWPTSGYISSGYGWRGYEFHRGVDVVNDYGAPVVATATGVVTLSEYYGGYGYAVRIEHQDGWTTLYGHCSRLVAVPGQRVKKGELIAYVGSTGYSTGPHVHYEVCHYGQNINPDTTLDYQRKKLQLLTHLQ